VAQHPAPAPPRRASGRGAPLVSIIVWMAKELRRFTADELARFNGENGTPIYIAFEGRVFDVTASKFWRGGTHMKRHPSGRDLTDQMSAAPHDTDVLDRFPQIGILVSPAGAAEVAARSAGKAEAPSPAQPDARVTAEAVLPGLPQALERFLDLHPFFRRHPHPMTVHFPIVFFIFAPLFTLLYLATGNGGFEFTALNCLAAGLLFSLVVIPTGLITWWVSYGARPMRAVTIKIVLSACLFVDGLALLLWRLGDPGVITRPAGPSLLFLALDFLLLPMVVVVAWYGATLTFPLARNRRPGSHIPGSHAE